ncbi:hypothetical protein EVAR_81228_1 [Eumeta japonica]|uniref:Uncharacterized protein n=1 Tax=Eumeta variegata TaxID=151549 RepID=A0A4C1V0Z4_EUMVA|nr:hypothetical protein EVAR_81228_1 [Eumeta japonica]
MQLTSAPQPQAGVLPSFNAILFDGTFYLQISGKSQLMVQNPEFESTGDIDITPQSVNSSLTTISKHCRTCCCNQDTVSVNEPVRNQRIDSNATAISFLTNERSSECQTEVDEGDDQNKQLNFKEEYIIYNEDQLGRNGTDVGGASSSNLFRDTENNRTIDNQQVRHVNNRRAICADEKDTPIIYDSNQLNVGSSQILEDNPFIRNRLPVTKPDDISLPNTSSMSKEN